MFRFATGQNLLFSPTKPLGFRLSNGINTVIWLQSGMNADAVIPNGFKPDTFKFLQLPIGKAFKILASKMVLRMLESGG